jgi:hypothetical protein
MSIFTKIQNPELDGVWGFAPIEGTALKLPKTQKLDGGAIAYPTINKYSVNHFSPNLT